MARPETKGPFINLDGTWVRHSLIAYATQRRGVPKEEGGEPEPYCNVVLTLQGARPILVRGTLDELFHAVHIAQGTEETAIGLFRARGMREVGLR